MSVGHFFWANNRLSHYQIPIKFERKYFTQYCKKKFAQKIMWKKRTARNLYVALNVAWHSIELKVN